MGREISRRVGAAARRDEFSGVVLVAKGERTSFHRAYGLVDRSWWIPNRLDTKFNLALDEQDVHGRGDRPTTGPASIGGSATTSSDYFPLFAAQPLLFEPGTASAYSNEGFVVLGAVVENLTGVNYFDYVRERIFRPLDMSSTDSYAIDDVAPNLAVGYAHYEDDPLGIGPRRPNWIFLQWKGSAAIPPPATG